jgi:hypothetical protein
MSARSISPHKDRNNAMTFSLFRFFRTALFLCLVAPLLFAPTLASAQGAGKVITLTPDVTVQRGGQTLSLKVQDSVNPGDILITDATGRVRVLFSDDSAISLGSNTVFTLEQYVAEGSKASFSGRMAKGLLRSITGKIVEQNPSGFVLTTPEATIGIRGTSSVCVPRMTPRAFLWKTRCTMSL